MITSDRTQQLIRACRIDARLREQTVEVILQLLPHLDLEQLARISRTAVLLRDDPAPPGPNRAPPAKP